MIGHTIAAAALALQLLVSGGQQPQYVHSSVTSYCDVGYTASGYWTHVGEAGGGYGLPFGTELWIPGYGVVTIEDRGNVGPYDVDIWSPTCAWSWQWGRHNVWVEVLRWGWGSE